MEFANDAQEDCYNKILPWMQEMFGEYLIVNEEQPEFGVMVGSAFAQTAIHPFQDDVMICTRAYVVRGADLNYSLLDFLLRETHNVLFGAFGIDPGGDIFFQHSILGSTCDSPELHGSVMAVALLADRYDDEIVKNWGGERALDQARHGSL